VIKPLPATEMIDPTDKEIFLKTESFIWIFPPRNNNKRNKCNNKRTYLKKETWNI
jgi:hypothetical protein